MTFIKKCSCKNEWQDEKYGKGMRVKNSTPKDEYRCTVCAVVTSKERG